MKDQVFLSPIEKDELLELIQKVVEETNSKLIKDLLKEFPHDEILSFNEFEEFIKRKGKSARKAIVGYNIVPHTYDSDANPQYLKSEVIDAIKAAPAAEWFLKERKSILQSISNLNITGTEETKKQNS